MDSELVVMDSGVIFNEHHTIDREDGNVIILDEHENTVWSSNQSFVRVKRRTVAQLLDSGNFVIRRENDDNPSNYLWQSFENPTDTLLPGMKLGWNRKTGTNLFLSSWKTNEDPGITLMGMKARLMK
ncbi:receptor-like serine/threonine-protein kinase SD1-8 [Tanacetum coccineum]